MQKSGPRLQNEGVELNDPSRRPVIAGKTGHVFLLCSSRGLANQTERQKQNSRFLQWLGFCIGGKTKVTFTSAVLLLWRLQSPVSNLLPHFLCYEMLGIVFSWLSCISIKSRKRSGDERCSEHCPLSSTLGFCHILRARQTDKS